MQHPCSSRVLAKAITASLVTAANDVPITTVSFHNGSSPIETFEHAESKHLSLELHSECLELPIVNTKNEQVSVTKRIVPAPLVRLELAKAKLVKSFAI